MPRVCPADAPKVRANLRGTPLCTQQATLWTRVLVLYRLCFLIAIVGELARQMCKKFKNVVGFLALVMAIFVD